MRASTLLRIRALFFRPATQIVVRCAVCGKRIEDSESRYIDHDPETDAKRHVHAHCRVQRD